MLMRRVVLLLWGALLLACPVLACAAESGADVPREHSASPRIRQQLTFFHGLFPFTRLGIAYARTDETHDRALEGNMRAAVAELGAEAVFCPHSTDDEKKFDTKAQGQDVSLHSGDEGRTFSACMRQLSSQCDAVYLTENAEETAGFAHALLPVYLANIPTFAMCGSPTVRRGALLGLAWPKPARASAFRAQNAETKRGRRDRQAADAAEDAAAVPAVLSVNLRAAVLTGWNPPPEVLAAADIFFDAVEGEGKQ